MTVLVTYADHNMTRSMELCVNSALKNGVDKVWQQNPDTITREFKDFNRDIFIDGARGAGCYWLFKPYHIYKAMLQMQDGDYLVYSDAGQEFVGPVQPVIDAMQGDIMLFSNGWKHAHWCKANVYNAITPEFDPFEDSIWVNMPQCQASLQIYKVCPHSKAFVKEWLLYCQMPEFIDDSPCWDNHAEFREHRHDQAILTCVAIKHGVPLRWFPTLTNMHQQQPGDNYPAIIRHHRLRNPGMGGGQPEW